MVKKDYLKLYIGAAIAFLIFMLLVGGGVAYYKDENFFTALNTTLNDMLRFRFHIGFTEEYQRAYLYSAFIYLLIVVAFVVNEEKFRRDAAGIEAGSAKWNDDLNGFSKKYAAPFGSKSNDSDENMIESQHVKMHINDMKTHHNNNVAVVGPAGKGKSRFFMKPNILQGNCSYVVTDPSGELLDTLGKVMRDDLGYKIKVFNLVNMGYSNQYNPFHYINEAKDVGVVVDCFLKNTTPPESCSSDPFWEKSETALLTAVIFFLKDFADEDCQNFRTVLQLVQYMKLEENAPKNAETKLDKLFNGKAILEHREYRELKSKEEIQKRAKKIEGSLAWENYQTFKLGGAKTLMSVLMSAAVRLNPFLVPEIANLTDIDTLEMDNIGDEKTVVFVIIPQANSTYNFLASMLFAQTFEALYFKAGKRNEGSTDEKGLRYKYHIRFLMDEYANIGNIPDFPKKISTMRKYNISATIVLQSISQIKQMHKDDYETLLSNCDTNILLGANDITTAEYYVKLMGKGTIRARSVGYTSGKKKGSSMNIQQTGRELMTIDEIRSMPFEKCIVLVSGEDPFYDDKYDLENHPRYKDSGDARKERRFNLMNNSEFRNFSSKAMVKNELNSDESSEAENEISKAKNISDLPVKRSGDKDSAASFFENIHDVDQVESMKYLVRMKHLADEAVNRELKSNKKAAVLCATLAGCDPRLLPGFTLKYRSMYQMPILLFCNDFSGTANVFGFFVKEDIIIENILRINFNLIPEILTVDEDASEDRIICRINIQSLEIIGDIIKSMRKGETIEDEMGEIDSFVRSLM